MKILSILRARLSILINSHKFDKDLALLKKMKFSQIDADMYLDTTECKNFFDKCFAAGLSIDLSKSILIEIITSGEYRKNIPAPSLDQNIFSHWGLDDEVHEILNKHIGNVNSYTWNDKRMKEIATLYDLILFIQNEIQFRNND